MLDAVHLWRIYVAFMEQAMSSAVATQHLDGEKKLAKLPQSFPEFMQALQMPGTATLSSQVFAGALRISMLQLAKFAGVHRSTLLRAPDNENAQTFMRECLQVIRAAEDVTGDLPKAVYWFKNEPLRTFRYQTPEQVVAEGKTANLLAYLESIEAGSQG